MYKTTNEAIGGIREIKVPRREPYFSSLFEASWTGTRTSRSGTCRFTDGPRFVIEILLVVGGIQASFWLRSTNGDFAALAGTVALFAAAAYRLMPIATGCLSSIAGLQFNSAVLDALEEGLALACGDTGRRTEPAAVPQ